MDSRVSGHSSSSVGMLSVIRTECLLAVDPLLLRFSLIDLEMRLYVNVVAGVGTVDTDTACVSHNGEILMGSGSFAAMIPSL